jgi:hypothetical protein
VNELTLWLQNLREALSAITAVGATVIVSIAIFLYQWARENKLDKIIITERILSGTNLLLSLGFMNIAVLLWRLWSSPSIMFLLLSSWVIGICFLLHMLRKAFKWTSGEEWEMRLSYFKNNKIVPDQAHGSKCWSVLWEILNIPLSYLINFSKLFWKRVKACSEGIEKKEEKAISYLYSAIRAFRVNIGKFPFLTLYGVFTNVLETYHQVFRKFLKEEASKSDLLFALEFEIRDVIAEIIRKGLLERYGLYVIISTINDHLRRHEQEKEYWIAVFDCFWNEFYKDENVPRIAKEELAVRDDAFSPYHWQVSCKNLDENKKYATITSSHFIAFLYKRFRYAEIDEDLFRALLRLIEALFPDVEPGTWFLCLLFLYCRGFLELLISEPWPWFVWIELEWSIPPPRFTREEKIRNTFELLFNLSKKLDFDLLPGVDVELRPIATPSHLHLASISWEGFFKEYIPSVFAKEKIEKYLEIIAKLKMHYKDYKEDKEKEEKIIKLNRLEELFNQMKEYLSQTRN